MSVVSFPGIGISIPVKDIAFRIFGWPIHWYGLIIATGFLLAVLYCSRKASSFGIEEDDILDLLIYAVPLCIIGARLYYIIFELSRFRKPDGSLDFVQMVRIWDGGLAIYGGVLTAIVIALLFCKKRGIAFFALADVGSIGLFIGQLVGRWGNFVNVECYGGPTDLPWRMGIYDTIDGVYQYMEVHPTFLYESLWNLVGLLLVVFVVSKHRRFDGQIFFTYLAWYGLGRAWIEDLRTDSLYFFSTGIRVSQVLAFLFFLLGSGILLYQLRRPHSPEELWVNRRKRKVVAVEEKGEAEDDDS